MDLLAFMLNIKYISEGKHNNIEINKINESILKNQEYYLKGNIIYFFKLKFTSTKSLTKFV